MSIGSDLIKGLSKWNNGEKLIRENNFIVIYRESYEIDDNFLPNNRLVLHSNIFGSSTSIRNRLQEYNNIKNIKINGLTSKSIIDYIQKNKLY